MTRRDEFDDPEGFQSAFGKIAEAMEQGHTGLRRRGPLLGILTATVALFILFAVFWSTYPRGDEEVAGPVPTLRADATPYKAKPENPGGMDIPYRDSTVFEAMRNEKTGAKIESLLPQAEQPIPKEQMFAGLKTEPIQDKAAADPAPPALPEADKIATADNVLDSGPVKSSGTAEHAGTILPEKAVVLGNDAAKTEPAAGNAKAETKPAAPAVESGSYYIQLGSVKDRAAAATEWKKLQKQFPDQLGSLSLRVQEANLGSKGTFYRIQGGAVAQASGKDICTAIAAKRAGGCIVVSR